MEKDGKGKSESSSLITVNDQEMNTPRKTSKALDVKVVVLIAIVAVSFIVIYCASCNNFGHFNFLGLSSSSFLFSSNATSSQLPVEDDLVHDEHYELRKALKAASTEDKTVILTTLNDAWAEPNNIFDLFLEGFRIGNNTARLLNHLLVIAVDEKAYLRCQASVPHCYLFKGNHSTSEMAHEARFMSPIYLEMMWERLAFLHTILTLGHNFIFTDTDIMWFRDPFPHFYPDVDFQTSCDQFNGRPFDLKNSPNNGFNFVRSNNRTIEFYKYWVSSRWRYPGQHEQNVFNKIKGDSYTREIGLRMRFLDTDYFGGFCTPSKDFNKVCTMHANCCVGLDKKIADLNTTIEDWKRYVSLTTNQTIEDPKMNVAPTTNETMTFHWRAPQRCSM